MNLVESCDQLSMNKLIQLQKENIMNRAEKNDQSRLSEEQMIAFEKFKAGHNLFISGPGGVGKSFLIKEMVKYAKMSGKKIAVTALTGCAAVLLDARTIHSWSGIRFMNASTSDDSIIKRISKNSIQSQSWKQTHILVVDEISMLTVRMFELLNQIGQVIRRSMKPFGGIQVIFTGDFYQLPPVCPQEEMRFCFESSIWSEVFSKENHIELKTFFRQRDPEFIKILMEVRCGELSEETIQRLLSLVGKDKPVDEPCCITKIYPVRNKVDMINKMMFERLSSEKHVYFSKRKTNERFYRVMSGREELIPIEPSIINKCDDLTAEFSKRELDSMVTNFNIIEQLELKKGALVMLTVNIDVGRGLCNGSQGIVIGFDDLDDSPIVKFTNRQVCTISPNVYQNHEYPTHVIEQYPLCLAWALTIHKTQGSTLDQIEVDIGSSVFEYGQTYVALSRVKTLEGLYLANFDPTKIRANPKVKRFYLRGT